MKRTPIHRISILTVLCVSILPAGCQYRTSSELMQNHLHLPVPAAAGQEPDPGRLSSKDHGKRYTLSARELIPIAFNFQPDIKSSFQRYKSEQARYDFFFSSRDSMTPRLRLSNDFNESRADETASRDREHTVELSLEKLFFDTTRMNVSTGLRNTVDDAADVGNQPFVSADVRYPLGASRERLERSSEDIFRRNELDDAQLGYIQRVRRQLRSAMFQFYRVVDLRRQVDNITRWLADVQDIGRRAGEIEDRDTTADLRRVEAEIARVSAVLRNQKGRLEVELAQLKSDAGLPFYCELDIVDEPFNPFAGTKHAELLRMSIDTDPEIATLRNAMKNAEVQYDLARRGRWDVALLIGGSSEIEGWGTHQGQSDWSVSAGLDISAVDPRVTESLMRQASSNIARFQQAIAARENAIYVDTIEPLIRIDTLSQSKRELESNLHRYVEDFQTGIKDYADGTFNIDDLLKRRENLFDQEQEISRLHFLVGANVADLFAATGRFFELLDNNESGRKGVPPS